MGAWRYPLRNLGSENEDGMNIQIPSLSQHKVWGYFSSFRNLIGLFRDWLPFISCSLHRLFLIAPQSLLGSRHSRRLAKSPELLALSADVIRIFKMSKHTNP